MRKLRLMIGVVILLLLSIHAMAEINTESEKKGTGADQINFSKKFKEAGLNLEKNVFAESGYIFSSEGESIDQANNSMKLDNMVSYDHKNNWIFKMHDIHIFQENQNVYWDIDAITLIIKYDGDILYYEMSAHRKTENKSTEKSIFHYSGDGEPPISDTEMHKAIYVLITQYVQFVSEKE